MGEDCGWVENAPGRRYVEEFILHAVWKLHAWTLSKFADLTALDQPASRQFRGSPRIDGDISCDCQALDTSHNRQESIVRSMTGWWWKARRVTSRQAVGAITIQCPAGSRYFFLEISQFAKSFVIQIAERFQRRSKSRSIGLPKIPCNRFYHERRTP